MNSQSPQPGMLFRVKVVDQAEFNEHLATLEDGQLGAEYDRDSYPELND